MVGKYRIRVKINNDRENKSIIERSKNTCQKKNSPQYIYKKNGIKNYSVQKRKQLLSTEKKTEPPLYPYIFFLFKIIPDDADFMYLN